MVVIGGITRLTESGLSITEWKPISGAIPPLSHADWVHAFDLYQADAAISRGRRARRDDPVRLQVHLLLGMGPPPARPDPRARLLRRALAGSRSGAQIPKGYGWRLVALFILGGLQGAVGWFMVMSGLEGRTEVSPYRLSAHLLFALFLFSALIWTALDLRQLARNQKRGPRG